MYDAVCLTKICVPSKRSDVELVKVSDHDDPGCSLERVAAAKPCALTKTSSSLHRSSKTTRRLTCD